MKTQPPAGGSLLPDRRPVASLDLIANPLRAAICDKNNPGPKSAKLEIPERENYVNFPFGIWPR